MSKTNENLPSINWLYQKRVHFKQSGIKKIDSEEVTKESLLKEQKKLELELKRVTNLLYDLQKKLDIDVREL